MFSPRCQCAYCSKRVSSTLCVRRNTFRRYNPKKRKEQKRKQRERKIQKQKVQRKERTKETSRELGDKFLALQISRALHMPTILDMRVWNKLLAKIIKYSDIETPDFGKKAVHPDEVLSWKNENEKLFGELFDETMAEVRAADLEEQRQREQEKQSKETAWDLIIEAWLESPLSLKEFVADWKDTFQQLNLSSFTQELRNRKLPLVKKKRHKKARSLRRQKHKIKSVSSRSLKIAPKTDYKILFVGGLSHGQSLRVTLAYSDKLSRWFETKEIPTQGPKKIPSLPSARNWDLIIVFSKYMNHEQINDVKRRYASMGIPIITAGAGGSALGSVPAAAIAAKDAAPWFYEAAAEMGIISKELELRRYKDGFRENPDPKLLDKLFRMSKAKELHSKGISLRQIRLQTGIREPELRRILGLGLPQKKLSFEEALKIAREEAPKANIDSSRKYLNAKEWRNKHNLPADPSIVIRKGIRIKREGFSWDYFLGRDKKKRWEEIQEIARREAPKAGITTSSAYRKAVSWRNMHGLPTQPEYVIGTTRRKGFSWDHYLNRDKKTDLTFEQIQKIARREAPKAGITTRKQYLDAKEWRQSLGLLAQPAYFPDKGRYVRRKGFSWDYYLNRKRKIRKGNQVISSNELFEWMQEISRREAPKAGIRTSTQYKQAKEWRKRVGLPSMPEKYWDSHKKKYINRKGFTWSYFLNRNQRKNPETQAKYIGDFFDQL